MKTTEVTEMCPHCQNEVTVQWNAEKDGYELYCPYCGFPIMLCSMCDARDGKVCDWEEIKGCKHSDERYRDYFYKNLSCENVEEIARSSRDNDGWIPVEERLPEKNEYFVDTSSNKEFPNGYYRRLEIAYMTDTVEYIHGYYDGHKWMDEYLDAIKNVVAWRIHEPYRPERSRNEE